MNESEAFRRGPKIPVTHSNTISELENMKWCLFLAAPCNGPGNHNHPELGLGYRAARFTFSSTDFVSQIPALSLRTPKARDSCATV